MVRCLLPYFLRHDYTYLFHSFTLLTYMTFLSNRLTEIVANYWMIDCGLDQSQMSEGKQNHVPRFLNRCLGMKLDQQSDITTYFHSALATVIKTAKQNGNYDVGIKTLTGRVVKFTCRPRVFHFRGEDAMNERMYMYTVQRDAGVDVGTAKRMYEENSTDQSNSQDNVAPANESDDDGYEDFNARTGIWYRGGKKKRRPIKTGLYIDRRSYLKMPKVFLLINSNTPLMKDKILRVRPNGKKTIHVNEIYSQVQNGLNYCKTPAEIKDAYRLWEKEFKAADCSSNTTYQKSCIGRHTEVKVLTGDGLVPILNKVLKEFVSRRPKYDNRGNVVGSTEFFMTDVIRVETGDNVGFDDDVILVESGDAEKSSHSSNSRNAENLDPAHTSFHVTDVTGEENVGDIIANKVNSLVTRGVVKKYKDDDHYDDQSPSGSFYIKLVNGKKMIMSGDEVYDAK